jgi:murein DD-endopeptidase MepM/ murein hydrolase activator NlpD
MTTEYGRLSGCILGVGDTVKQGEEIARTGGTTLYFGTSVNEEAVSATEYLTP